MGSWVGLLLLGMLCALGNSASAAAPVFGRYVGLLKHDKLKREQLAKLDLVASRENGNELELTGILTLHFGDFKSGEYANYHFDKVIYHALNRTLVFDQADQEVRLKTIDFSADELKAQLKFGTKDVGTLSLKRNGTAAPTLPLLEPLQGDFQGKCDGFDSLLRIQTFRSTQDTSRIGNPFAAYQIHAQLGEKSSRWDCGDSERYCKKNIFDTGSYNFFENRLQLFYKTRTLTCTTGETGLDCGTCRLTRISGETKSRVFAPPTSTSVPEMEFPDPNGDPALRGNVASLEGEYRGYLHHEYLDTYQPASINLLTYQSPGASSGSTLRMSANATLFFGDFDSSEAITYRFTERGYPNPLLAPQFVFKRSENDVDAVLQVTSIGKGEVRGIWYSILFGRVGTFSLFKEAPPKLPSTAHTMEQVSGMFESSDWDLELAIGLDRTPPNTDNPFYPLTFGGSLVHKDGGIRTLGIDGGSFNFYTGKIAINVAGEFGRTLSGERTSAKRFLLHAARPQIMTVMSKSAFTVFRSTKGVLP